MRTAPEIVRAALDAQIILEVCAPDQIETFSTHCVMDAELARDIECNLPNVLALLRGAYYGDRVNCWMH